MFGVRHKTLIVSAVLCLSLGLRADAATLEANSLSLNAGEVGTVFVTGSAIGEVTFGVNVLVEIVPQPGSVGTVTFSPSPPSDISLIGDPWPGVGTFTAFDTDTVGSLLLNGGVKDNGTFVPAFVDYVGDLVAFPVVASANASGTWDVVLSTSSGVSGWEGLTTTLTSATITVVGTSPIPATSSWALAILALLVLSASTIIIAARTTPVS